MKVLVTGGAGFIGSHLIRHLLSDFDYAIVNIDVLTYAGMTTNLSDLEDHPSYNFERTDIRDYRDLKSIRSAQADAVMHLAAESHVDRSIDGPGEFVSTNVVGTYNLWRFVDITGIHCPKRNNVHFDFTIYQQMRSSEILEYVGGIH